MNPRQRRPADAEADEARSRVATSATPLDPDTAGTFVWPPEMEALESIEVVSLDHLPADDAVAGADVPVAIMPEVREAAEFAPTSYADLEDADLETLFAPPQAKGGSTVAASTAPPTAPFAASSTTNLPATPVDVGITPAVEQSPPSAPAADVAPTLTPANPHRPGRRGARSDGRWKPAAETVPAKAEPSQYQSSAVVVQPDEKPEAELLIVPSAARSDAPSKHGTPPTGGGPPAVHIRWDRSLDDDVPAMPLSGLAKGRELAEARRAQAQRSRAALASDAQRESTRHVVHNRGLEREVSAGAPLGTNPGSATVWRPRAERSFGAVWAGFVGVLVVLAAFAWFAREAWWPLVAARVFPSQPAAAAVQSRQTGETAGGASPSPFVTSETRMATPSAPVAVPPPERVEPAKESVGTTVSAPGRVDTAQTATPGQQGFPAPAQSSPAVTASNSTTGSIVPDREPPVAEPPLSSGPTGRAQGAVSPDAPAAPRDGPADATARTAVPAPTREVEATSPAPTVPLVESVPARDSEREVREALASYRAAYNSLDAGAAQRVWPTVDARALARAFSGLKSQSLRFDRCDVQVRDAAATAACEGTATYIPRVGRQDPQTEPRRWAFSLRQGSSGWRIERAEISK